MPGDVDDERVVYEQRNVSWRHGENGEVIVQARLTAEGGAAVIAAIEAATQTGEDVAAETTVGQRRADALVAVAEMATAAMASGDLATVVANVVVIADVGVLSDDDPDGCCHIADGPALAPETARRLACDCAVDFVVQDGDGSVLDVGRRTRSVPPALRRAVLVRDGCWSGRAVPTVSETNPSSEALDPGWRDQARQPRRHLQLSPPPRPRRAPLDQPQRRRHPHVPPARRPPHLYLGERNRSSDGRDRTHQHHRRRRRRS